MHYQVKLKEERETKFCVVIQYGSRNWVTVHDRGLGGVNSPVQIFSSSVKFSTTLQCFYSDLTGEFLN